MPTYLGLGQQYDATFTTIVTGARHRVVLQEAPTADPLEGVVIAGTDGSGLYAYGVRIDPDEDVHIQAGTAAIMRVTFADTQRVARGSNHIFISTLTSDSGGAWHVQHTTETIILASAPAFLARTSRSANGDLLLIAIAALDTATSITVTANGSTTTHAWEGRRSFGGRRAWLLRLPAATTSITLTMRDAANNTLTQSVEVALTYPRAPHAQAAWNLPSWLPGDGVPPTITNLLAAASEARNDASAPGGMLDPRYATGEYLDTHGRLYGVTRHADEDDDAFRERIMAIPRSQHLTRHTLEAHLTRVAGGTPIRILDATTQAVATAVRLMGTHTLDGTWQLGGPGAGLTAGEYLLRLEDAPTVPVHWVLDEFHRLRPMGMHPMIVWSREITLGVARALMGARDLDANPALQANVIGEGSITSDITRTRYLTASVTGEGDIAGSVTALTEIARVTWIELEAPDA